MVVYNTDRGFQSAINAALGDYQSGGFRLVETADRILELYYQDDLAGVFSPRTVTVLAIRESCREYLEPLNAS